MSTTEPESARKSIDEYLVQRDVGNRIVWRDSLIERGGAWVTRTRMETSSGAVVSVDRGVEDFCWSPGTSLSLASPAFHPAERSHRQWQRFQRVPIEIELSRVAGHSREASVAKSLLGFDDLGLNPLVATDWEGWTVWFPALTLLSAVAAPNKAMVDILFSAGAFGMRLNVQETNWHRLVLTRTYSFPLVFYKPRAYECLAYWLEQSSRRHALRETYARLSSGQAASMPLASGVIRLLGSGFACGGDLVVQQIGLQDGQVVWPRTWSELLIQDLEGTNRVRCRSSSPDQPLSQRVEKFRK